MTYTKADYKRALEMAVKKQEGNCVHPCPKNCKCGFSNPSRQILAEYYLKLAKGKN